MAAAPYHAVVIGSGSGGRSVARTLAGERRRVAMVERELVGGECPFWACMPTKTLLRPVEARWAASHVAGLRPGDADWAEVAAYRDYMNSGLDDRAKTEAYERMAGSPTGRTARRPPCTRSPPARSCSAGAPWASSSGSCSRASAAR